MTIVPIIPLAIAARRRCSARSTGCFVTVLGLPSLAGHDRHAGALPRARVRGARRPGGRRLPGRLDRPAVTGTDPGDTDPVRLILVVAGAGACVFGVGPARHRRSAARPVRHRRQRARRPASPASASTAPSSGCSSLTGAMSALAGVFWTLRFASARADNGDGLELAVVAAVLLGGVSIFGGRGTLVGVIARRAAARHAAQRAAARRRPANSPDVVTGVAAHRLGLGTERRPAIAARARCAARRCRPPHLHTHPPRTPRQPADKSRRSTARSTRSLAACASLALQRSRPAAAPPRATRPAPRRRPRRRRERRPERDDQGGPEDRLPAQAGQQPVLRHVRQQGRQGRRRGVQGRRTSEIGPSEASASAQVSYINTLIPAEHGRHRGRRPTTRTPSAARSTRPAQAGIKVVTYDSDTKPDCRDLFINQATAEGIGRSRRSS